jgi:xanthine dehydrogenase YagT iron-sulfur-binding subunit
MSQVPADPPSDARRQFLLGTSAVGAAMGLGFDAPGEAAQGSPPSASTVKVHFTLNGMPRTLDVDPRVTLLDALRERLRLTGTKKGCDRGQCGACTVLVNGRRVNSCLTLAATIDGAKVTTIEGLATAGQLGAVQVAFLERDAFQCGYCTPGQVMSCVALLDEAKHGAASAVTADLRKQGAVALTDDEIRERMSGNICRCGAYVNIVAAVRDAAGSQRPA